MIEWTDTRIIPEHNSFHGIRLICCIIVVIEHCLVKTNYPGVVLDLRSIAVDVFFALSGFWVYISASRANSWKEYSIKRIKRILPMYYTVVIMSAVLLSTLSNNSLLEYFLSKSLLRYLLANLFFLNFLGESLPGVFNGEAVNGSLWTIKIEVAFYFILPIIIILCNSFANRTDAEEKKKKRVNAILLILVLLSLTLSYGIILATSKLGLPRSFSYQIQWYLPLFIFGMLFAINYDFLLKYYKILALIFLAICIIYCVSKSIYIWPFYCAGIAYLCIATGAKCRFLSFIKQDFSFPIYLTHYPILMSLNELGCFKVSYVFGITLTLCISFLFAFPLSVFQRRIIDKKYIKNVQNQ